MGLVVREIEMAWVCMRVCADEYRSVTESQGISAYTLVVDLESRRWVVSGFKVEASKVRWKISGKVEEVR